MAPVLYFNKSTQVFYNLHFLTLKFYVNTLFVSIFYTGPQNLLFNTTVQFSNSFPKLAVVWDLQNS